MKYSVLVILFVTVSHLSSAQLSFEIGSNILTSIKKDANCMRLTERNGMVDTNFNTYKVSALGLGLLAYPKYHFLKMKNTDISVGLPVTIGINPRVQNGIGTKVSLMYDANIGLDVNGGRMSINDYDDEISYGYYVGMALGIINTNGIDYDDTGNPSNIDKNTNDLFVMKKDEKISDKITGRSFGLTIHAGLAIPFFGIENRGKYCIRLFIKPALNKSEFTFLGGGLFILLGTSDDY